MNIQKNYSNSHNCSIKLFHFNIFILFTHINTYYRYFFIKILQLINLIKFQVSQFITVFVIQFFFLYILLI